MNKDILRNNLTELNEIECFRDYVSRAIKNNDNIKIKVKTSRYSMFFEEIITNKKQILINSKTLLKILDNLVKEMTKVIDKEIESRK